MEGAKGMLQIPFRMHIRVLFALCMGGLPSVVLVLYLRRFCGILCRRGRHDGMRERYGFSVSFRMHLRVLFVLCMAGF